MENSGVLEPSSMAIKRYMHEKSRGAVEQNTRLLGSDFDDLADDLGETMDILYGILDVHPPVPDHVLMAATMNLGVLNTILAAIELRRLGYFKEPMMLIRDAVESACVAYEISLGQEAYEIFVTNPEKYDSPKAVGKAKDVVGIIGTIYGLLSKYFTHTGGLHVAPNDPVSGKFYVGGFLHEDCEHERARLSILMLKQSISSVCMLIQVPSPWNTRGSKYWMKTADETSFVGRPYSEKAITELDEMRELLGQTNVQPKSTTE